jgi:EAL domain-containing protein (putative c-di-GMP-specific phosphodiesterase class I)|tara:strand:+ start:418 stop:1650 length:1233 start_codon:yes stop_codon:yes gene_type:complete
MDDDALAKPILANTNGGTASLTEDLQRVLSTLRSHLGMDVAFISEFSDDCRFLRYVDTDHQHAPLKAGDAHPLEETYCHRIVTGDLPEIIPDTHANPTTRDLAITRALAISSYIGVPIRMPDGSVYGTFCCFDQKPGAPLTLRDLSILRAFADFTGKRLDKERRGEHKRNELKRRVGDIIDEARLEMAYQPIYHVREQRIVGFEALARFHTEPYQAPHLWFAEAERAGLGEALELLAVREALKGVPALPDDCYLSLNVSPNALLSGAIMALLADCPAQSVVLEITEHARISDYQAFLAALKPMRQQGIRIAVDDAGAGYASFQHILELNADIIKLDISLIRNIHADTARRALAAALIKFAEVTGSTVIAEGVETETELEELRRLGVEKVQGFYIGRPMPLSETRSFQTGF